MTVPRTLVWARLYFSEYGHPRGIALHDADGSQAPRSVRRATIDGPRSNMTRDKTTSTRPGRGRGSPSKLLSLRNVGTTHLMAFSQLNVLQSMARIPTRTLTLPLR